MKTPREILFQRHEPAAKKLEVVRQSVLRRELPGGARTTASRLSIGQILWEQLIFPCRRTWMGLAAVWVAILVFLFQSEPPKMNSYAPKMSGVEQADTVFSRQRQIFAELNQASEPLIAEPPKPRSPRPRSQRHPEHLIG